ncbi:hypothetical protein [Paenibacillus sp. 1011MAR3C5]|uniref:hypothetical protein n=1 Tax=Paenibacillus sp. 1011MAR3C5 TaxID=1675787 RepID=UPI0011C3A1A2|nr:hypothetical protein [Paenibacillus sp. 1011MAR3C5]
MEKLHKQAKQLAPVNGDQPLLESWIDIKSEGSNIVGEVYFAAIRSEDAQDEKSAIYLHEVGGDPNTTQHLKFLERPFQENYQDFVNNLAKEIGKEWR